MLSYLSHLLQPLNVACFAPLKRSYGDGIAALARSYIYYISKETFLLAFKAAYKQTFTKENACAGFRGARLVLFNLDTVLLKLNVRLRTLTLLRPNNATWEAKTPRNAKELEAQTTLIRQRMQRRLGSSASSLNEQVRQLSKGAQQIAHNIVLLQEEQARMRSAIEELTKRKSQKRRYIRVEETLIVSKVSNLIAKREGGICKEGETPAKRVRAKRRCGRCGEVGHNSRTCKVEIEDRDNSEESNV